MFPEGSGPFPCPKLFKMCVFVCVLHTVVCTAHAHAVVPAFKQKTHSEPGEVGKKPPGWTWNDNIQLKKIWRGFFVDFSPQYRLAGTTADGSFVCFRKHNFHRTALIKVQLEVIINWPDLGLAFSVIPSRHGSPTLMTHTQRLGNMILEKKLGPLPWNVTSARVLPKWLRLQLHLGQVGGRERVERKFWQPLVPDGVLASYRGFKEYFHLSFF